LDPLEVANTATSFADQITLSPLSQTVLDSYYAIDPATHLSGLSYQFSKTINSVSYSIDTQLNQFVSNTYTKNLGSGGSGLLDLKGMPRVKFSGESFTNNGDSQREVSAKIKATNTLFAQSGTDTLVQAFTTGSTP
jgi:hypothetical protein